MTKLLLVDCDGTIRSPLSSANFCSHPRDQRILPGADKALVHYHSLGWPIVGITNQGGVAAGFKSLEDAIAEQKYTLQLFPQIDHIFFCPDFEGNLIGFYYNGFAFEGSWDMLRSKEIADILFLYESGKSQSMIARKLKISTRTISKYLKLLGASRKTSKYQRKKYRVSYIVELYNFGMSCRDIARQLKLSHPTISKVLKKQGIPLRSQNSPIGEREIKRFLKLYCVDCLPYRIIAIRNDLPLKRVSYHISRVRSHVRKRLSRGESVYSLAAEFELSVEAFYNLLERRLDTAYRGMW